MKKAVFLDRDGVIIEDSGYIDTIEEVKFFPFTMEALKELNKHYELFIVTNQSGIGRGLITEEGVDKVHEYILDELRKNDIHIREVYCCTHINEDKCICRKPNPYFLLEAEKKLDIDLKNSFVIGDHPSDVELAVNAGATGIYVLTGHGEKHLRKLKHRDVIVDSLKEAVEWILDEK
ncbi:D-glycero-alpha-D-manno-heptose-1,7-bisphosphate 7-phosphatase [Oceanirhabdus sp. W0125-5]|uniref:D-glycero-alpha-D-manno-heptose-1,7-bisphosphate 7-phosphatase n=1 Tax=Oceanirhabdus sp. W0125-5 TaxID=2999116 RepID=UPI0022F2C029|nr:HAD family hydrolase [Oceanirhabdus sp. W0125-5]WBW96703.1 HAD family hydrolase [Oceanirhabdus sp. W0125-5]